MPVQEHCVTTNRTIENWLQGEQEYQWLMDMNNNLFDEHGFITLSRQDIFNTTSLKEIIIKTIYWGYTGGMRGNHFMNILNNIDELEGYLEEATQKEEFNSDDFVELSVSFNDLSGLGLSTYSKLLYFLNLEINGNPSLILDLRLIKVFNMGSFDDLEPLINISYQNAPHHYVNYLEVLNQIGQELDVRADKIEMFLFLLGANITEN